MKKTTKILSLAMIFLLSILSQINAQCYTPTYPSGNLFTNPSFDGAFASQTGWTQEWTNFDPKSTENSCGTDTSGSLYLKGGCYPNGGVLKFNSGVPIVAGHRYRILASIKNETAVSNAFNFHLPSGIWDLADTNNHPSAAYLVGIPNGMGWVKFDQVITAGPSASGNVEFLFMSCDGFESSTTSDLIYLDNFEIYDIDANSPTIIVSNTQLLFNESNTQLTFNVTGNYLSQDIVLTPPSGITLDITTISQASASTPTTVTATWDGVANIINQKINITSGSETKEINVISSKDSNCFTPLNANINLITDPTITKRSNFGGWGDVVVAVDASGACGATSALLTITNEGKYNAGGAAFDINNITYAPNTQYGFLAKIKTVGDAGSAIALALIGDATFDDDNLKLKEINTSGSWATIQYSFTTGTDPSSLFITFNSADIATGTLPVTETAIDNLELYDLALLSTEKISKNELKLKVFPNPAKDVLNIDSNLKISSVKIFDLLGRNVIPNITLRDYKSINISSLSKGTYILQATSEGKVQTVKFVK